MYQYETGNTVFRDNEAAIPISEKMEYVFEHYDEIKSALQKNSYSTNPYVDKTEISSDAMELFQRDLDIKHFTQTATSDMNNFSHLERMKELFSQGVVDVYEDDVLSELVTNSKLWNDLEL